MAAKLIFARGRALESYVDSKKKWESGLKTARNGRMIFSAFRRYLQLFNETDLIVNNEFVEKEHDFIMEVVRYWYTALGEALSPQYYDAEYVKKEISSLECAYFVADLKSFECKRLDKWEAVSKLFGGKLLLTLSFNIKKKLVRLEVEKKENGNNSICSDQVFVIDTDYSLTIDSLKKEMSWKNVALASNEFGMWKIEIDDKNELESCHRSLSSFVKGSGISNDDNEAAMLFDEKDSMGTSDDLPSYLLVFGEIFDHLQFLDKIMLPQRLKQHGYTFLNSLFVTLNHGVSRTKQDNDFWNRTFKYLFNYYKCHLINYLSMVDRKPIHKKLKRKRVKLCEDYDSVDGENVKRLIQEDIMFMNKLIGAIDTSKFYLKKFLLRFVGAYALNKECQMSELFKVGMERIENEKTLKLIVESCDIVDLWALSCRNGQLWSYLDGDNLVSKTKEAFLQVSENFDKNKMSLDEKEMEAMGKEFKPLIDLAIEKGFSNSVDSLKARLKAFDIKYYSFVFGVLFILLLFKQYQECKELKGLVMAFCQRLDDGIGKNKNNETRLVSWYIFTKAEEYCRLMAKENDNIWRSISKIRSQLSEAPKENEECEKSSDGDWDDDDDM